MSLGYDWTKIKQLVEVQRERVIAFKITPDKSITNHSNYKFFKDIHELERKGAIQQVTGQLLRGAGDFLTKAIRLQKPNGFRIVLRPATDYVWYEIMITADAIDFYILCYESNRDFVRLKLEQTFPYAPIEEVDPCETFVPEENTLITDLHLQRHNFFSIHTDYSEQSQPIEDILANAEDVKDDDILKFSMRVQPFDMEYWSYKAEEWHKKTLKGKAPKRIRVSKNGLVGLVNGATELLFQKLSELFRELHTVAFKGHKTEQVIVQHSTAETREVGDISRQSHYKSTAPVFRTVLRIASHSEDETRRLMNLKSLANSFIDLKDTNNSIVRGAIIEKPNKTGKWSVEGNVWKWKYEEIAEHKITPISHTAVEMDILCDKELGKLMQLPTSTIQKKFSDRMKSLGRKEIGIPEPFLDESGIFIGYAEYKGERHRIFIPCRNPDEFVLPIIVSGIQGAGKDTFAVNWVVENAKQGRGAVIPDVIDEKGRGMSDAIINSLPREKLIVLDFADEEYSPYLDWCEATHSDSRFAQNRFASELVKFFEAEDEAGVQTERYLREAAKALPRGTVIQMGLLFHSEEFRKKVIKECEERGDASTAAFWTLFEKETENRQRQIAAPILNRLHKLIGDTTLKPIFGQIPTGKIRFDQWLYEGKVIVCKIPKTAFSTTGIRTLVHWIAVKTWLAKQAMLRDGRKCESFLVLNEPHQIFDAGIISTLEEIFPESRKTGLGIVTLFHDFAQVPKDLADIMLASGANFVLLKQRGDKTWKRFLHRIEPDFGLEDCLTIKMHEAMIGFLIDKNDQPVIRVQMNDMPWKRGCDVYSNEDYVKECLREYGRPVKEVEKEVLKDELLLLSSAKKVSAQPTKSNGKK